MDINELCRKYVECVDEIAHLTARLDEVIGNLKAVRLLYAAAVETRDHVLGAIAVAANRSAGYSVPTPAEPAAIAASVAETERRLSRPPELTPAAAALLWQLVNDEPANGTVEPADLTSLRRWLRANSRQSFIVEPEPGVYRLAGTASATLIAWARPGR